MPTLCLNGVPVWELADDELDLFTGNLAVLTRCALLDCEGTERVEGWLSHWVEAANEVKRRGMCVEPLFEVVC